MTVNPTTANRFGYRGVYWANDKKVFRAEIGNNRKGTRKRLGNFATAEKAAEAYDIAAIDRYGDKAILNFPLGSHATFKKFDDYRKMGLCPHGHDLAINAYMAPSGAMNCRRCNAASAARLAARLRTSLTPSNKG